jgi:hypothetical protein
MATPSYQGQGQPAADYGGSWFGRLASFFGGGTPRYSGSGQPAPGGGGYSGGSSVPYKPAPTEHPKECVAYPCETDAMTCPIDPEALASGHIAIVIPRERPAQTEQ